MDIEQYKRAQAIFDEVVDLPTDTVAAAVGQACGTDAALEALVLELLELDQADSAVDDLDSLLDAAAEAVVPTVARQTDTHRRQQPPNQHSQPTQPPNAEIKVTERTNEVNERTNERTKLRTNERSEVNDVKRLLTHSLTQSDEFFELFVRSFVHFVRSLRSFVHFVRSFVRSFTSFVHFLPSFLRSFVLLCVRSFVHSLGGIYVRLTPCEFADCSFSSLPGELCHCACDVRLLFVCLVDLYRHPPHPVSYHTRSWRLTVRSV